jgi:FAD/FMN-containing dehydrogenase
MAHNPCFLLLLVLSVILCNATKDDILALAKLENCLTEAGIEPSSVVSRGESIRYKELNFQRNTRGGILRPLAYLLVKNAGDIQKAVKCGRKLKIHLVAKGGGHSNEKYSYGNRHTLVIDLQLLDSVKVSPNSNSAEVGPGNLIGPLYWKLYQMGGYLLASGECPTVGVSGIATGGGYGFFSRAYGLTSDNILEAEVITADGRLVVANSTKNPDLYWAIRGAGGGSFGIISKFTFRLNKASEKVALLQLSYPIRDFPEVFSNWQNVIFNGLPNSVFSEITASRGEIYLQFSDLSGNLGRLQTIMQKFPARSTNSTLQAYSWPDFLFFQASIKSHGIRPGVLTKPSDIANITRMSAIPTYDKEASYFMMRRMNPFEILKLFQLVLDIPEGGNLIQETMGGKVGEIPSNATAYVHRDFTLIIHINFRTSSLLDTDLQRRGLAWVRKVYTFTKFYLKHTESYQNYDDADMKDGRLERYYGSNLPRLVQIKKKYDPTDYFHGPQTIRI